MAIYTENLNLFKYTQDDRNKPFNLIQALNDNWDILDSIIQSLKTGTLYVQGDNLIIDVQESESNNNNESTISEDDGNVIYNIDENNISDDGEGNITIVGLNVQDDNDGNITLT